MTIDMHAHWSPPALIDMYRARTKPPQIVVNDDGVEVLKTRRGEQAFDADLALFKGGGFVFLEGDLFLGRADQFFGHGEDLLTQGAVLGFILCGCKKRNIH